MYLKLIIPFLFLSFLQADNNRSVFDEYHETLCQTLVNTSNSIDDYFVDKNSSRTSKTHAEFSTSVAKESRMRLENDVRFRIRLDLPKIEENLRVVFEDDSSDNLLYDGTTLNDQHLDSKEYYLRLEYLKYMKDTFNMRVGAGLKVRRQNLVPYFNVRSHYEIQDKEKSKSELFNRFRYYSDGEIENNFQFNTLYTVNDKLYTIWSNQLYHTNENPYERFSNDFTFVSLFNDKQHIRYGFGISSHITKFQDFKVDYYDLHTAFHHVFYKKWAYYEVAPSILQRDSHDFKTTYRLLLKFGIYLQKQ